MTLAVVEQLGPQHDGLAHTAAGALVGAGELGDVLRLFSVHSQGVQVRIRRQVHLGQLAQSFLFGFVEVVHVGHARE